MIREIRIGPQWITGGGSPPKTPEETKAWTEEMKKGLSECPPIGSPMESGRERLARQRENEKLYGLSMEAVDNAGRS